MIDTALLRVIKNREDFNKLSKYLPVAKGLDKRTKAIAKDVQTYFEDNPDEMTIDFEAFRSLFFTTWHVNMKEEQIDYYNKVLDRMEKGEVPDSVRKNMINSLLEVEFATDIANIIEEYQAGDEVDVVQSVKQLLTKLEKSTERAVDCDYLEFSEDAVEDENSAGYEWPLECMNEVYRNILPGDQYIIAARPGKGKTTFLTHLNVSLAQNMPDNKVIVWFNNESKKQRIISRQIQSALYKTETELREIKASGKLNEMYSEVMGSTGRVRVYDIHGKNVSFLEDIIETIGTDNIGAIIFDMLDNVRIPMYHDAREDLRLEALYQWSRELGVRCNCPVFPTSQVNGEGDGLLFPSEAMLKGSTTGKQGATDGIVIIGASDDPLLSKVRGLSMPKDKCKRPGQSPLRAEVLLDEDRGRYIWKTSR